MADAVMFSAAIALLAAQVAGIAVLFRLGHTWAKTTDGR